ncbi:hypothetical protein ACR9YC_01855 [Parasphingorhabdus sp. DH2-15]|uniref:hypothetical protein n=1 Tax=Parasphingorhabdus sp. DH2-15 TaxID=3444112 RepID=UPI003F6854F0
MVRNFKIMLGKWKACLFLIFIATPFATQAQNSAENEKAAEKEASDEIVVDGARIRPEKQLPRILDSNEGQLARFEGPFCPHVSGLPEQYKATILRTIKESAIELGLDSPANCEPNALIIFTTDAEEYMQQLRKKRTSWFNSLTPRKRRLLTQKPRSFYSWHSTALNLPNGEPVRDSASVLRQASNIPESEITSLGNPTSDGGRIETPAITAIESAFIVMDLRKTNNMSLAQLSDFALLHLIVDFNDKHQSSYPENSLLNLFSGLDPLLLPKRMSEFDRLTAFGLYRIRKNTQDAWTQSRRVARYVREQINGPETENDQADKSNQDNEAETDGPVAISFDDEG